MKWKFTPVPDFRPPRKSSDHVVGAELRLADDAELYLFDGWAQENTRQGGIDITYWRQDVAGSRKDPLYSEVTQRAFDGPFTLIGLVEYPTRTTEPTEKGMRLTFEATTWIARVEVEQVGMKAPGAGDVLRFWEGPFFAEHGESDQQYKDPNGGFFFDVVSCETDGHPFDAPGFVGFKLQIRRKTEFTAERRLLST